MRPPRTAPYEPGKESKHRMAELRATRRDAGFTEISMWVHPEDVAAVRRYSARKLAARDPGQSLFAKITKK